MPTESINPKGIKKLSREIIIYNEENKLESEIIFIKIKNGNISTFYGIIKNLDDHFSGGEYIIEITISKDYPFSAPKFKFLTPNGIFQPNVFPCVNVGHFHAGAWNPSFTIKSFIRSIVGLMLCTDMIRGIAILTPDIDNITKLAKNSKKYNRNVHMDLISLFEE